MDGTSFPEDECRTARFAVESNKLDKRSGRKRLYQPWPRVVLSVFMADCGREDLEQAARHVANERDKPVYGCLLANVEAFRDNDLDVQLDYALQFGSACMPT